MKMKLIERRREAPGVESFVFAPEESLTWKAGQYAQYVLDHETADDRGSQRWFTISSAPYDRHVMLTTRFNDALSSTFKSRLKDFNVGDEIEVAGIEGDFTLDDTEGEYVFLAGGIGVTPFHSMVRQFAHEGAMPRITLLHANSDAYAPFKDQLDTIASRYARFQVKYLAPG